MNIFCLYHPNDREYFETLHKHFAVKAKMDGYKLLSIDRILPGEDLNLSIKNLLLESPVYILLVSSDFLYAQFGDEPNDQWPYSAIDFTAVSDKVVVPIIVRDCLWEITPLAKWKALPPSQVPIARSDNKEQESVYLDICRILDKVIKKVSSIGLQESIEFKKNRDLIHELMLHKNWTNAIVTLDEIITTPSINSQEKEECLQLIKRCNQELGYHNRVRIANASYHSSHYDIALWFYQEAYQIFQNDDIKERMRFIQNEIQNKAETAQKNEWLRIEVDLPLKVAVFTFFPDSLNAIAASETKSSINKFMYEHPEIHHVIYNLEAVEYIDSSGLLSLLSSYRLIQDRRGKMMVCNVNQAPLRDLFSITKIEKIVAVYSSVAEAKSMLT